MLSLRHYVSPTGYGTAAWKPGELTRARPRPYDGGQSTVEHLACFVRTREQRGNYA